MAFLRFAPFYQRILWNLSVALKKQVQHGFYLSPRLATKLASWNCRATTIFDFSDIPWNCQLKIRLVMFWCSCTRLHRTFPLNLRSPVTLVTTVKDQIHRFLPRAYNRMVTQHSQYEWQPGLWYTTTQLKYADLNGSCEFRIDKSILAMCRPQKSRTRYIYFWSICDLFHIYLNRGVVENDTLVRYI